MTTPKSPDGSKNPAPPETGGEGNSGRDREGGDKRGRGTFEAGPEPEDLTRGAPPKPVKRYSQAG